jgi:hypothetical protein
MAQRNLWAACLQETWPIGDSTLENGGLTFIHHGLSEKPCKRGALGVAIVLSLEARKAWERAGSKIIYFGPRIRATRLRLHGTSRRRPLTLLLVSAYSPDSGKPQAEHEEYADALRRCAGACGRDILVVRGCGTDTNSSLGVRKCVAGMMIPDTSAPDCDRVRGPRQKPRTTRMPIPI